MTRFQPTECSLGCRSQLHGAQITAAIIRGTEAQAIAYMKNTCHRCHLVTDASGKSALHTAASCGKRKIVQWLLAQGVPLNQKDSESSYTPLHRALFYGQVHIAVALIKAGANLSALDCDALTPLDHINFDRHPFVSFTCSLPNHVYVWGSNSNFNLGQSHQRARSSPEWLEFMHREGQVITDVSLNKFHTLFLATSGRVYACGLSHGGRLGLELAAPIVIPRPVKGLLQFNVIKIATGPDHSIFLTDTGQVWTCGTNTHHQLGLVPPPEAVYTPKVLSWHKNHREEVIVGVGAARYHSVIWTTKAVYTFGLNAGQLGHFKNDTERTIDTPRKVTSIVLREEGTIACVGVSDGATVVSTSLGDIYVLHQYQTRKVASRMMGIVKIACIGGHLDSRVGAEELTEKGGSSLKIAVLIGEGVGHLYLWTQETAHLSRCLFTINRKINLVDFCLNVNSLAIVTDEGEAFSAVILPPREKKATDKVLGRPWGPSRKFNEFTDRSSCIMLRVTRIVALHRTVAIMCDSKGCNFVALQNNPNSFLLDVPQISDSTIENDLGNLLLECNEYDTIHDVIIHCDGSKLPAHSYILAYHSKYFRELLVNNNKADDDNGNPSVQEMCGSLQDSNKKILNVSGIKPEILQEVLTFIYSGSCQLTTLGPCNFKLTREQDLANGNVEYPWKEDTRYSPNERDSEKSFNIEDKEEKIQKNSNKKKKKGQKSAEPKNSKPSSAKRPLEVSQSSSNKRPLQLLKAAARMLKITSLIQELEHLQSAEGLIQEIFDIPHSNRNSVKPTSYDRHMYEDLYDVMIQSKSGDVLGAHKCILAARLEYFNCMFSASWLEATESKSLSMPIPTSILTILLDFLYEDDSTKLYYCRDIEFLCNVLVVADQFLMGRMKECCEVAIVGLLTLKNAGELLEFAVNYNCDQLKVTTMQFISLNLAAMLENGSLMSVSSDLLMDLSAYYRKFIPRMSYRVMTPFEHPPYAEELARLLDEKPLILPDSDEEWDDLFVGKGDKQQNSAKKKKRPRRNSQGESRTRKASTSSQLSVSSSDCDGIKDLEDELETLNFDDLEERDPPVSGYGDHYERKCSSVESMTTSKMGVQIPSQTKDSNSWQKVGKKKISTGQVSTTPTETPRESPVKEMPPFPVPLESPKSHQDTAASLKLKKAAILSKSPSGSFESPVNSFPSLNDSFSKAPKASNQIKNNKIVKLSQKQRKKQAAEAAVTAATAAVEESTAPKTSISSSPWGTSSSITWGATSIADDTAVERKTSFTLADIMKAEEASAKQSSPINIQHTKRTSAGSAIGGTASTPSKKGWSSSNTPPVRQWSKDSEGGAWPSSATSPLSSPVNLNLSSPSMGNASLLDMATPSFSKILLEEETHMGNLMRERCKPLSLIQLEDRAIEDLYSFYGANECFEEKITVSRIRMAVANPTWKKS